jgi:hypothetical protein
MTSRGAVAGSTLVRLPSDRTMFQRRSQYRRVAMERSRASAISRRVAPSRTSSSSLVRSGAPRGAYLDTNTCSFIERTESTPSRTHTLSGRPVVKPADALVDVVGHSADGLVREDVGSALASSTVSGSSDQPEVGQRSRLLEQRRPAVPAAREQPNPANEDDRAWAVPERKRDANFALEVRSNRPKSTFAGRALQPHGFALGAPSASRESVDQR